MLRKHQVTKVNNTITISRLHYFHLAISKNQDSFVVFSLTVGGNYFPIVLCLLQHHSSSNIKHPQRLAPGGKQSGEEKRACMQLHFLSQ